MLFNCKGTPKTVKEMTLEDLNDWINYFNNTIPTLNCEYLINVECKKKMEKDKRVLLKELKKREEEK